MSRGESSSMIMDSQIVELREIVQKTLEAKGVLGTIRAQLRAAVFTALEDQERHAGVFLQSVRARDIEKEEYGRIFVSLICEYLEFYELERTLSVFLPEAAVDPPRMKDNSRQRLVSELGLPEEMSNNTSRPLLLDILIPFLDGSRQIKSISTNKTNERNMSLSPRANIKTDQRYDAYSPEYKTQAILSGHASPVHVNEFLKKTPHKESSSHAPHSNLASRISPRDQPNSVYPKDIKNDYEYDSDSVGRKLVDSIRSDTARVRSPRSSSKYRDFETKDQQARTVTDSGAKTDKNLEVSTVSTVGEDITEGSNYSDDFGVSASHGVESSSGMHSNPRVNTQISPRDFGHPSPLSRNSRMSDKASPLGAASEIDDSYSFDSEAEAHLQSTASHHSHKNDMGEEDSYSFESNGPQGEKNFDVPASGKFSPSSKTSPKSSRSDFNAPSTIASDIEENSYASGLSPRVATPINTTQSLASPSSRQSNQNAEEDDEEDSYSFESGGRSVESPKFNTGLQSPRSHHSLSSTDSGDDANDASDGSQANKRDLDLRVNVPDKLSPSPRSSRSDHIKEPSTAASDVDDASYASEMSPRVEAPKTTTVDLASPGSRSSNQSADEEDSYSFESGSPRAESPNLMTGIRTPKSQHSQSSSNSDQEESNGSESISRKESQSVKSDQRSPLSNVSPQSSRSDMQQSKSAASDVEEESSYVSESSPRVKLPTTMAVNFGSPSSGSINNDEEEDYSFDSGSPHVETSKDNLISPTSNHSQTSPRSLVNNVKVPIVEASVEETSSVSESIPLVEPPKQIPVNFGSSGSKSNEDEDSYSFESGSQVDSPRGGALPATATVDKPHDEESVGSIESDYDGSFVSESISPRMTDIQTQGSNISSPRVNVNKPDAEANPPGVAVPSDEESYSFESGALLTSPRMITPPSSKVEHVNLLSPTSQLSESSSQVSERKEAATLDSDNDNSIESASHDGTPAERDIGSSIHEEESFYESSFEASAKSDTRLTREPSITSLKSSSMDASEKEESLREVSGIPESGALGTYRSSQDESFGDASAFGFPPKLALQVSMDDSVHEASTTSQDMYPLKRLTPRPISEDNLPVHDESFQAEYLEQLEISNLSKLEASEEIVEISGKSDDEQSEEDEEDFEEDDFDDDDDDEESDMIVYDAAGSPSRPPEFTMVPSPGRSQRQGSVMGDESLPAIDELSLGDSMGSHGVLPAAVKLPIVSPVSSAAGSIASKKFSPSSKTSSRADPQSPKLPPMRTGSSEQEESFDSYHEDEVQSETESVHEISASQSLEESAHANQPSPTSATDDSWDGMPLGIKIGAPPPGKPRSPVEHGQQTPLSHESSMKKSDSEEYSDSDFSGDDGDAAPEDTLNNVKSQSNVVNRYDDDEEEEEEEEENYQDDDFEDEDIEGKSSEELESILTDEVSESQSAPPSPAVVHFRVREEVIRHANRTMLDDYDEVVSYD